MKKFARFLLIGGTFTIIGSLATIIFGITCLVISNNEKEKNVGKEDYYCVECGKYMTDDYSNITYFEADTDECGNIIELHPECYKCYHNNHF